jgi:hypothetical protein
MNIDKITNDIINGESRDTRSPVDRRKDFYKEGLHGRELKEVGIESISLDNTKLFTRDFTENNEYERDDAYGINVPVNREREVGTYDANGGSIVYVDGEGREWMTPFTKEAQQALVDAGYQTGSVAVPHMFDMQTRFVDENLHVQWLELCKKAGVEGKDFPLEKKAA